MPLELGIFLGAQRLGTPDQRRKRCLILDREKYRYQQFISDIAGQDIEAHDDEPMRAVKAVRNWLSDQRRERAIPGPMAIWKRYQRFRSLLPFYCETVDQEVADLTFNDYTRLIARSLREHPQ
jgi:hypothetical protein